jgi:ABC-2 type transport system permease protein
MGKQRVMSTGTVAYALVWVSFPLFNLLINALIYRDDPALRNYAVIGGVIAAFLFGMLFNAGQILDEERYRGTLGNLFLAPCPRYAWLGGMQVVALVEAVVVGAISLLAGWVAFDLTFDIDLPALLLSIILFLPCLWAFSMVHGAIGVALRGANSLSNLISPFVVLLAGVMFPIALTPDWLRIPARLLPFGYGIDAIYGSSMRGEGIADLWRSLLPLAGFAVVLPLLGIAAFDWLERLSRQRGELELA